MGKYSLNFRIIYLIVYSVDATFATGLGRHVNDAKAKMANCRVKKSTTR